MSKTILVRDLAQFRERLRDTSKVHTEVTDHLLLRYPVVESLYVQETTVNEAGETVPVLCLLVDDEMLVLPGPLGMLYELMLPVPEIFRVGDAWR